MLALVFGAIVLLRKKGTAQHRVLGAHHIETIGRGINVKFQISAGTLL